MKKIPLTNSLLFALVDDEDFEELSKLKWFRTKHGHVRSTAGREKATFMHRVITGLQGKPWPLYETDHQDLDGLNNQRYGEFAR